MSSAQRVSKCHSSHSDKCAEHSCTFQSFMQAVCGKDVGLYCAILWLRIESYCIAVHMTVEVSRTSKSLDDRSFTVAAPYHWNSLPLLLCDSQITVLEFRLLRKTHLFAEDNDLVTVVTDLRTYILFIALLQRQPHLLFRKSCDKVQLVSLALTLIFAVVWP